jgi:hypothetical protein
VNNLYDLLATGVDEAHVAAWLSGQTVSDLPLLSPRERASMRDAWWFWARPGQHWSPGVEFITDYQCGRGFGKSISAAHAIAEAACDPERWGGVAMIVGPDPIQVKRDCLFAQTGLFSVAKAMAKSGNGPAIVDRNLNDRWCRFDAPRGGGDGGLTVLWAASSDPKSGHGGNIGLMWWDEYGVSYHNFYDAQGNNLWGSLVPAIRAGADPKIIITQTPSKKPEVRVLQADAERPECPTCRRAWLAENKTYQGEPLKEPWRLPRSPQPRLHDLLNTRTTVPERVCDRCGGTVVARVRTVFGDTRDNPAIAASARERADAELASGRPGAHMRYAPRGEVDSGGEGTLVRHEDVREVLALEREEAPNSRAPVTDRWRVALDALGITEVVVFVDPAVTARGSSDETGVVAAGLRRIVVGGEGEARTIEQVVALQEWSVRPDEVAEGAPSLVWAPRAWWLARYWGASRIIVETNQGGLEVLSAVTDLQRAGASESSTLAELRAEFPQVVDARLSALARRVAASSCGIAVESKHRRANKRERFEWYGRTAALGQQAILCATWQGGAGHWATALSQVTGYEVPTAGTQRTTERKDRGDAVVGAAQVLLRVVETHRGEVEDAAPKQGWMGQAAAAALRR